MATTSTPKGFKRALAADRGAMDYRQHKQAIAREVARLNDCEVSEDDQLVAALAHALQSGCDYPVAVANALGMVN